MICPNCKTENRETAKFCDECGTRLDAFGLVNEEEPETESPVVENLPELDSISETPEEEASQEDSSSALPDDDSSDPSHDEELEHSVDVQGEDADLDVSQFEIALEGDDDVQSPDTSSPLAAEDDFDFSEIGEGSSAGDSSPEPIPESPLKGLDVDAPVLFDVTSFDLPKIESSEVTREIPTVGESVVGQDYQAPSNAWKSGGTMEMPKTDASSMSSGGNFRAPDPNDKKKRRKESREMRKQQKAAEKAMKASQGGSGIGKKVLIAILLLVVLGVAIAAGTYYLEMWGGKTIPDCTGKTEADAKMILEAEGFKVRVDTVSSDDTEGLVLLSDPSSGERIEKGSEVIIHVATSRIIPDIIGKTEEEAKVLLAASGYENISDVVYEKSNEHDDYVKAVSPEVGAKAKSAAKITLTVEQAYRVPDVSGLSEWEAIEAIKDAGYGVYVNYVENPYVSEGTAIDTYPAKDEIVESETVITLNVAQDKATKLENAASAYLSNVGTVVFGITSYQIDSVKSVSYSGNNQVAFVVNARPFGTILGQTVYLSAVDVSGIITFDDSGQVLTVTQSNG